MTFFIFETGGESHPCQSGQDFLKAMGAGGVRRMVMVDENGELIGAGNSLRDVERSEGLLKALKTEKALPLRKSSTARASEVDQFEAMFEQLQELALRKAIASGGTIDLGDDVSDLQRLAISQQKRIIALENALAKMQDRLG